MICKVLFLLLSLVFLCSSGPTPPVWPSQYTVTGVMQIPYFNIKEPVTLEYDAVGNREKISYYDGMDNYTYRFDLKTLYQVVPRIDTLTCFKPSIGSGPMISILPDLSSWSFSGTGPCGANTCNRWELKIRNYNKTGIYEFLETNGTPYVFIMTGYDFVFGSHPDIYIFSFTSFTKSVNQNSFAIPSLCSEAMPLDPKVELRMIHRSKALLGQLGIFSPKPMNDEFESFVWKYNKYYFTEELAAKRATFYNNHEYIQSFNKRTDKTHKLAINKFADLDQNEMKTIMRPNAKKLGQPMISAMKIHHKSDKALPNYVNWVEVGAVTPVKDQGICGSCFTFGTTGTLEGAYFLKTGILVSLSEQQIVDCSWGVDATQNQGCDGGFAANSLAWVMQNHGIATEKSYPYLMQDHWCNGSDVSSGVQVRGYVNVTEGDESALQDAIANNGPTAVAIDASHPEFTFYSSGVYFQPDCGYKPEDLDHEVLTVGYGTEKGQDYWLVKNSWSTHWGDRGFVKMARNRNNNCGIASQANYPIV